MRFSLKIGKTLAATFEDAAGDASISVTDFQKTIVEKVEKVTLGLMKKVTEFELADCSQRWHTDIRECQAQLKALRAADIGDDGQEWLPLSEPLKAPNGIWLRPLTSQEALQEQGAAQNHCVGTNSSYYTQCLAGRDHIISLTTDREGEIRLTTVQLREKTNGHDVVGLDILTHEGYERRIPDEKEQAAINWYIKTLMNDPQHKPDWGKIEEQREKTRDCADSREIVKKYGFDPLNTDCAQIAYELIRPYAPKTICKKTFEKVSRELAEISRAAILAAIPQLHTPDGLRPR